MSMARWEILDDLVSALHYKCEQGDPPASAEILEALQYVSHELSSMRRAERRRASRMSRVRNRLEESDSEALKELVKLLGVLEVDA